MSEFLNRGKAAQAVSEELDVQKAVVESLAADKAEQDEHITHLRTENDSLKSEIASLNEKIAEMKMALEKVGDILTKNAESELSNKVALLDRNDELNDRFPGETRDHVLEVIREVHEQAEKEGRLRRAQILESVLCANTPTGNLSKKREELKRFFAENGNILTGTVIAELEKSGIAHKHGEEYLLTEEILKRNY